jgi:hypothetical protein
MKATLSIALLLAATQAWCQAPAPQGEIKGQAIVHTPESTRAAIANGALVLPAAATGGAVFTGAFKDAPREMRARVPVVVFLHGSSGLGLKAIGEWQQWLATMGIASFAPDSFALPARVTYTSPVGKDFYEKIHALRGSEITLAVQALKDAPWADPRRMVLAGTSEGATAVARYAGDAFAARMIFSWSCEDNYFVESHRTAVRTGAAGVERDQRDGSLLLAFQCLAGPARGRGPLRRGLQGSPEGEHRADPGGTTHPAESASGPPGGRRLPAGCLEVTRVGRG